MTNPLDRSWGTDLRDLPGAIIGTPRGRLQKIQEYMFGKVARIVRIDGTYGDHYTPGKIHMSPLAWRQTPEICRDERAPGRLLTFDQVTEQ